MMIGRLNKILFAALVLSVSGLWAPEALAQRCAGCLIFPNPKNRNPDRREDRPNLPPESDSRDSSVRPSEIPTSPEGTDTSATIPDTTRVKPTSDEPPPDPRNSAR